MHNNCIIRLCGLKATTTVGGEPRRAIPGTSHALLPPKIINLHLLSYWFHLTGHYAAGEYAALTLFV
jgi:hypothetical protein